METQTGTEKLHNRLTAAEVAELGSDLLTAKWSTPREFTLAEVTAFAPLLGMTPEEFVSEVLS